MCGVRLMFGLRNTVGVAQGVERIQEFVRSGSCSASRISH